MLYQKSSSNQESYDWQEKTFLIVEDNQNNFQLLETFLKSTKVKIIWVEDGGDAVLECSKNNDINLILMDIQLPTVSGFDATQKIRAFNPDIPIIAQTAFAMVGDREKSLEAGCNDYIAKPIRKKILLAKIARYL